jgi:hypothetical protein
MLNRVKRFFSQVDPEEVIAYQYKVPVSIDVEINKNNGHYILRVDGINGKKLKDTTFYIEADTVTDLIYVFNDSVLEKLVFAK